MLPQTRIQIARALKVVVVMDGGSNIRCKNVENARFHYTNSENVLGLIVIYPNLVMEKPNSGHY